MENYYCEVCNKNIAVGSNIKPICQECGYYLVKGTLSERNIEQRQMTRTEVCIIYILIKSP